MMLDAAIQLTAESGLNGFSLAEAQRQAGLNRGIAAYHFQDAGGLQKAVVAKLLITEPPPAELGLRPMLAWMQDKIASVAADGVAGLARARLITSSPTSAFACERKRYRDALAAVIGAHLARGQLLEQVRADLDPAAMALVLVGQLHGEQMRVVTTGEQASPLFVEMVERAVAVLPHAPKPTSKGAPRGQPNGRQQSLFGDE